MQIDRVLASRWWYLLPVAGILYYFSTVIRLADHTPKLDDLNDVFGFFKQLALAQTPLQKAGAFFYPNNEHVTLVDHLIYFTQYQLLGEIRFYPLILIGHLIIIATGLLLGTVVNSERRPFCFAVTSLAYINLHYWDSSFKAMTAISNQVVLLFAIATLFALLRWRRLPLALLFATLATFSQGNGVLVWPLGLLVLVLEPHWQAGRWRVVAIWCLSASAAGAIYLWAHHTYNAQSPATTQSVLALLPQQPLAPLLALLAFLGSTAFTTPLISLAIVTGVIALLVLAAHSRQADRQTLLLAIALFLLASAITASGLRGLVHGETSAMESRYRMYSTAFVLLALLTLLEQSSGTRRALAAALLLAVSVTIHASGYRHIPTIQNQARQFSESYQHWLVDGDFRRQAVYFPPMSDHFLFVAAHLQLFDPMQLATNGAILRPLPSVSARVCPPTPAQADHCPMTMRHRGNAIAVAIEAAVDPATDNTGVNTTPALPANITLCDAQANTVMAFALPDTDPRPVRWLVPEADIPAGTYRVLFQSAQQTVCETQLTKKPRKVETEMRTLFGR